MSTWIDGLGPGEIIGGGGSSSVYRAIRRAVGDQVAVKILLRSLSSDDQRRQFEREARALAELSECEGIIAVLDHGETDRSEPFLVMPLLAGSTQGAIRSGPVDWAQALEWTTAAARAVHQAHSRGIVHRDIKPANLLLTSSGEVFVSDFGIASLADTSLSQSRASLTPAYASPEVLHGARASVRSDVYSLAATFAALVIGRPPFAAEPRDHWTAEALRIRDDPPPDLAELGVPERVAAVIAQAMAKDPGERPQSAAEFGAMLGSASHLGTGDPTTLAPELIDLGCETDCETDVEHPTPGSDQAETEVAEQEEAGKDDKLDAVDPSHDGDPVRAGRPSRTKLLLGGAGVAAAVIAGGWFGAGLVGSEPERLGESTAVAVRPVATAVDVNPTATRSPQSAPTQAADRVEGASVQVGDLEFITGAEVLGELQDWRDGSSQDGVDLALVDLAVGLGRVAHGLNQQHRLVLGHGRSGGFGPGRPFVVAAHPDRRAGHRCRASSRRDSVTSAGERRSSTASFSSLACSVPARA